MKTRPILFGASMIKAILDGRKSQTRRVMAPQPAHLQHHEWRGRLVYEGEHRLWCWRGHTYENLWDEHIREDERRHLAAQCPYGKPGDRLWVREEHYRYGHWERVTGLQRRTRTGRQRWRFVADTDEVLFNPLPGGRLGRHHHHPATSTWHKRLARFMPRALSRMTLDVTEVSVQRLQEISAADACDEGVTDILDPGHPLRAECYAKRGTWTGDDRQDIDGPFAGAVDAFTTLWDSINGDRAPWSSNPWVWAITFRRLP